MSIEHGQFIPADPEITKFSTGHYAQRVTINETFIMVEDPWLGDFVIGDVLSYGIHTTPLALRGLDVTQLCKSRESSTIPNLASFSREWGMLAQDHLIERFGKEQGLSPDHIAAIKIKLKDDLAHTARSHELELAVQRWSGPENWHETMWPPLARIGGVTDVLDKHGITYDQNIAVPGYPIPEWAAATTREDIDVDRLQYIATEALLWFDHEYVDTDVRTKIRQAVNPDSFTITPDGQLAFKNPEDALVVSKLIMLFSTEHWNDPLNRAHLHLDIHGVQRTILQRRLPWMDEVDKGETRDPKSYYHATDSDFDEALITGPGKEDGFIYVVSNTLNSSGMEERRKFIDYRLKEYCRFILDDKAVNYPSDYLEPKRVEFGPRSSSVDTQTVELTDEEKARLGGVKVPQLEEDTDNLTYLAGPLKNRYIDPLVQTSHGFSRLSEINTQYKELHKEHQHLQSLGVRVGFSFTPDYAEEFRAGMQQNDAEFEGLIQRGDMTSDQRRRVIELAAIKAVAKSLDRGTLVLKRELPQL